MYTVQLQQKFIDLSFFLGDNDMPTLDQTTKSKIEQDYLDHAGHPSTTSSEQYSDDPLEWIWGSSAHTLDMNIPLRTDTQYFDLDNPDETQEPNLNASTTNYDLATLGGWKVTLGSDPVIVYHVRFTNDLFLLRDAQQKKETLYYTGGAQIRTNGLANYKHHIR